MADIVVYLVDTQWRVMAVEDLVIKKARPVEQPPRLHPGHSPNRL